MFGSAWEESIADVQPDFVPVMALADSVTRGEAFNVTISTWGGRDCTKVARTEVIVDGLVAKITPYNKNRVGASCAAVGAVFRHSATLRFAQAGTATVTVTARGEVNGRMEVTSFQDSVIVR